MQAATVVRNWHLFCHGVAIMPNLWTCFGYSAEHIQQMVDQEFWETDYAKIKSIDPLLEAARGKLPL